MEDFDKRIAAATDAEVKTQYQSARAALDDQRRYRAHIRQDRERLVARMHNHVTTLEKFQLAATGLEAARGRPRSARPQQLDELSQDVAASGEALAEIELGVRPRRRPRRAMPRRPRRRCPGACHDRLSEARDLRHARRRGGRPSFRRDHARLRPWVTVAARPGTRM